MRVIYTFYSNGMQTDIIRVEYSAPKKKDFRNVLADILMFSYKSNDEDFLTTFSIFANF